MHRRDARSSRTASDLLAEKRSLSVKHSRAWRSRQLSSKRLRSSGQTAEQFTEEQQVRQAADLTNQLKKAQPHQAAPVLRQLCCLLSTGNEDAVRFALESNLVNLLIKQLQRARGLKPADRRASLDAAWILTNVAAGEHGTAAAAVPAGPSLVAHLGAGLGLGVAQQCAWALGNLAGDCQEWSDKIEANGAILPLVRLLLGPLQHEHGALTLAAAQTAAWALSNILHGSGRQVGSMVGVPDCLEGLSRLLEQPPSQQLAQEAAWLLASAAAAASDAHLAVISRAGCFTHALTLLNNLRHHEASAPEACLGNTTAVPLLRAVGHALACGGPSTLEPIFSAQPKGACSIAEVLKHYCGPGQAACLQQEAAWALGSLCGLKDRIGSDAILMAGALEALLGLLHGSSTWLARREAAFAIANLSAGGAAGTGSPEMMLQICAWPTVLQTFLEFLSSEDQELVMLGLQWLEMFIRTVREPAKAALMSAGALQRLTCLQSATEVNLESQQMAAHLIPMFS
ncbi:hypothetical protein WJX74_009669 [Apatococcus lobatus]|uniref:Importin subunit alpha n=1 Tax=Apatococcus lobatus TaxID=904363 RepID=A0AAW1QI31_9CHLO